MFRKLREQLSCIECSSVTAEDIYLADKRNAPFRRSATGHHDDFYVRSRSGSFPSSINSSFNHSRSSHGYPAHARDPNQSFHSLPNHGRGSRRVEGTRQSRTGSAGQNHSFHNDSSRSGFHAEQFGYDQRPSLNRLQRDEHGISQYRRNPGINHVQAVSFDSAQHDSSLLRQHTDRETGITHSVQLRNPATHRDRRERPHSATASLMRDSRPHDTPHIPSQVQPNPIDAPMRHQIERRHSTSNMVQQDAQRRARSVSFAGPDHESQSSVRRRARSVSESEDVPKVNLCGNALSTSLVSIVKHEWRSQSNLASDNESSAPGKKQMKSILKKSCPSVESNSPDDERKLKTGSTLVTFADNRQSSTDSSLKQTHVDHNRKSPVPFVQHQSNRNTEVDDLPGAASDIPDCSYNKTIPSTGQERFSHIKRVDCKPPLPHTHRPHRPIRDCSDDSDSKPNETSSQNIQHTGTDSKSHVEQSRSQHRKEVSFDTSSSDVTGTENRRNRTHSPAGRTRNVPKKFIAKRRTRSSSIDSDNCSSSVSSDSFSMETKSIPRNCERTNEIKFESFRSTSLDLDRSSVDSETKTIESQSVVPVIRKGRVTNRRNRRPASTTMTFERVDSDTTDSGLSLDYSAPPLTVMDMHQFRRGQRMKKKTLATMSLPRDMQFSSTSEHASMMIEDETVKPDVSPLKFTKTKQALKSEVVEAAAKSVDNGSPSFEDSNTQDSMPLAGIHKKKSNNSKQNRLTNDQEKITDTQNNNSQAGNVKRKDIKPSECSETIEATKIGICSKQTIAPKGSRTSRKLAKQKNVLGEESKDDSKRCDIQHRRNKPSLDRQNSADFPVAMSISSEDSLPVTGQRPRRNSFDEVLNNSSARININNIQRTNPQAQRPDGVFRDSYIHTHTPAGPAHTVDTKNVQISSQQQLLDNDVMDWTLTASDLPSSSVGSASLRTPEIMSDLVIKCEDTSMKSYMDQNDVSRVLVPRESIRTGRLMMKDETNTFCMCSGTFRVPTSNSSSQTKCRPVTIQIYRGLNDKEDRINLLKNTTVLLQLNHQHVHAVYGMCLEGSPHTRDGREVMVLLERTHYLVTLNQLLTWTSENNPQLMTTGCAITFGLQMCSGLQFLESKGIIHANLSSNTIRLDRYCNIKIGGIEQFPVSSTAAPIRWMALETLSKGQILPKSTVWTFAVILWEILSIGGRPYQNLKIGQILNRLMKGHRLPRPPNCSQSLYHLLLNCWQPNPEERPSFANVVQQMADYKDKLLPSKSPAEIFPDREDFWKIVHDHI